MASRSRPRLALTTLGLCVPVALVSLTASSCGTDEPSGLAVLGAGSHSLDAVELTILSAEGEGLDEPTDLAFNPDDPSELWVMNRAPMVAPAWEGPGDPPRNAPLEEHWPSVTVYFGLDFSVADDGHSFRHVIDPWGVHHMANVSSVAFGAHHVPYRDAPSDVGGPGDPRSFATCQESRNQFKGYRDPNDFQGPNLWSGKLGREPDPEYDFFGESFEGPVADSQATCLAGCEEGDVECEEACLLRDPGSHLDMLHESPNCMGIAWERDNVYWVMDGCGGNHFMGGEAMDCAELGDIVRYDFQADHGPGRHDHSDGLIERYAVGVVEYVPGVPSHMQVDQEERVLFAVDSGQNRILAVDIDAGQRVEMLPIREGGTEHWNWVGARIDTLVEGSEVGMELPSGLALYTPPGGEKNSIVLVTDNAQGKIYAFDRKGALVDELDLGVGAGALMGIDVAGDGSIVGVDAVRHQVWRLAAKPG